MNTRHNIMVTLSKAELDNLEKLSNILGCSKSRVISQGLLMLDAEFKSIIQPISKEKGETYEVD